MRSNWWTSGLLAMEPLRQFYRQPGFQAIMCECAPYNDVWSASVQAWSVAIPKGTWVSSPKLSRFACL